MGWKMSGKDCLNSWLWQIWRKTLWINGLENSLKKYKGKIGLKNLVKKWVEKLGARIVWKNCVKKCLNCGNCTVFSVNCTMYSVQCTVYSK